MIVGRPPAPCPQCKSIVGTQTDGSIIIAGPLCRLCSKIAALSLERVRRRLRWERINRVRAPKPLDNSPETSDSPPAIRET